MVSFNIFNFFPLQKFRIEENSMSPFLKPGDTVLISRFGKIKIGDVVVFEVNDKHYVKRIEKIKGDKYFLTGDNKKESIDSRRFGWIEKKDIIGKVIANF
ncbi:MAG: hypothetical protein A3B44_00825 [Candidatus Levybacteria bacterium RIFCSPLOWO2_01_FULL_38_21]|nr:MAG: hypothetical protein A3B44_00825 [Candidatus Levybacteria bacterium RIFCSPLOWO2_01_FULL_38_21]